MTTIQIQNKTFITDNGNVAKVVATIEDGDNLVNICYCPEYDSSFMMTALKVNFEFGEWNLEWVSTSGGRMRLTLGRGAVFPTNYWDTPPEAEDYSFSLSWDNEVFACNSFASKKKLAEYLQENYVPDRYMTKVLEVLDRL